MPTFTAIALDRLLEPAGASKSSSRSTTTAGESKLERRNSFTSSTTTTTISETPQPTFKPIGDSKSIIHKKPAVPHPKLSRRNSTALTTDNKKDKDKPSQWPQISPALYATPESTPLPDSPDSPTSFPPSPYIINHKRRGPRLSKSVSVEVLTQASQPPPPTKDEVNDDSNQIGSDANGGSNGYSNDTDFEIKHSVADHHGVAATNANHVEEVEKEPNGFRNEEIEGGAAGVVSGQNLLSRSNSEREGENEDFFDPQESMSFTSNTDGEDYYGADRSARATTPMGEFYDAWEELSSESGRQPQRSIADLEIELREIRLSLLMEIEKRKQAEETLNFMRSQWQALREKLGEAGLILPAEPPVPAEYCVGDADYAEEICRQISVLRFVSQSIGRGTAKAEFEAELEAQLETKNFEIARLSDRLHYYEAMNREMSQRNQEAIEMARRDRQRKRRRQKWVWGSVAAAITLGSAALAWSYLPSGKGSSASSHQQASDRDHAAE